MEHYRGWHVAAVIIGTISLLFITYATILMNTFKTPETTADFFRQSNAYYYVAEIVKANIRNRYPRQLRNNVVQLTIADALLNFVVSPNTVERIALPVLRLRQKAAQLPLSFAESNLVLNTQQYTHQAANTLSSLGLPQAVITAGNNLIAAIPPQVTIVDTQKHPNSILASITRTRIFFEHIQTLLTIFWLLLVISFITLLVVNLKLLRRLISDIFWIFVVSGGIIVVFSFVVPAFVGTFSSNPDPIAGVLKDQLIDGMVWQYFMQTIPIGILYLLFALIFFLILRFVPFPRLQMWTNTHLLRQPQAGTAPISAQQSAKPPMKKRRKR